MIAEQKKQYELYASGSPTQHVDPYAQPPMARGFLFVGARTSTRTPAPPLRISPFSASVTNTRHLQ